MVVALFFIYTSLSGMKIMIIAFAKDIAEITIDSATEELQSQCIGKWSDVSVINLLNAGYVLM